MSARAWINLTVALSFTMGLLTACGDVNSGDFIIESNYKWPWPQQAEFRVSDTAFQEVPVNGHTRVQIAAENGQISITGNPGATSVAVTAVRRVGSFGSREDAEQGLSQLDVRVVDLPDKILVQTLQPPSPAGRQYVVDYTITVPSNVDVDVGQDNGSILLDGMAGSVVATTSNGRIDATASLPPNGTVWLSTANGDIGLRVPTATSATLFAFSDNGTIDVHNLVLVDQVTTSQTVTGILGTGAGDIQLENVNGSILVTGFDG